MIDILTLGAASLGNCPCVVPGTAENAYAPGINVLIKNEPQPSTLRCHDGWLVSSSKSLASDVEILRGQRRERLEDLSVGATGAHIRHHP